MIPEANGKAITFENCAFSPERENLADNLTEYLKLQKDGYVLNVDGEWGSGKTFFLKAWQNKLNEDNPTCFIDAWNIDYLNDPLITIASKVLDTLHNTSRRINPEKEKLVFNRLYRVISAVSHLSSSAISETISPIAGKTLEAGTNLMDSWLLSSGKSEYDVFRKSEAALGEFKETLQNYINDIISQDNEDSLLYIFIDELDRCRPNYAIELLEAVKHLFCLKNTVFIIATNRSEMEKSIRKVYGNDFKSENYLSRFFDRNISIHSPSKNIYLSKNKKFKTLIRSINEENYSRPIVTPESFLSSAFEFHNIELREVDKIIDQMTLSLPLIRDARFSFYTLSYLFILKESHRKNLYSLYPTISLEDIKPNHTPPWTNYSSLEIDSPGHILTSDNGRQISFQKILEIEFRWQDCLSIFDRSDIRDALGYFPIDDSDRYGNDSPNTAYNRRIRTIISNIIKEEDTSIVSFPELFHLVDASSALQ
jgi:hypothetical protein